jgi:signal transduction histidine kinase
LLLCLAALLTYSLRQANQKLEAAASEVEDLNKAREQFFGIIAHDLRRPLHAFEGLGKLINHYIASGDQAAITKISGAIDQSSFKIRQLLDNLLHWALSQKEEIPYQPEHIMLRPKLEEIIDFLSNCTTKKRQHLASNALITSVSMPTPMVLNSSSQPQMQSKRYHKMERLT